MPDQDPVAGLLAACEPFIRAAEPIMRGSEDYSVDVWFKRVKGLSVGNFEDLAEAAARLRAAPDQQKGGEVRCRARWSSMPDPQDCDWPECGCDPVATRVLESITESGRYILPEHLSRKQIDKLACAWGYADEEAADHYALMIETLCFPEDEKPGDAS